jgi:hypothetical protein
LGDGKKYQNEKAANSGQQNGDIFSMRRLRILVESGNQFSCGVKREEDKHVGTSRRTQRAQISEQKYRRGNRQNGDNSEFLFHILAKPFQHRRSFGVQNQKERGYPFSRASSRSPTTFGLA